MKDKPKEIVDVLADDMERIKMSYNQYIKINSMPISSNAWENYISDPGSGWDARNIDSPRNKSKPSFIDRFRISDSDELEVANAIPYEWKSAYNSINKIAKKTSSQNPDNQPRFNPKKAYKLSECLKAFRELYEKDFGQIYLTGSVALKLQGIISREQFKDLDIIMVGEYTLDDDIYNYQNPNQYPVNELLQSKPQSLIYSNIPLDMFVLPDGATINEIAVEYKGQTYICQHYRDILKAKLNMILPRMKDYQEILDHHMIVDFK